MKTTGRVGQFSMNPDLLMKVHSDPSQFKAPVRSAMTDKLENARAAAKVRGSYRPSSTAAAFAILRMGPKFLG
jgi:hypothetical protein